MITHRTFLDKGPDLVLGSVIPNLHPCPRHMLVLPSNVHIPRHKISLSIMGISSGSGVNYRTSQGFIGSSAGKESTCNVGDLGSIPGLEDPLEKGKDAHSSILAWRIPGMGEPGGLQSMGSHRVGHD